MNTEEPNDLATLPLPSGWTLVTLDAVGTYLGGGTPSTAEPAYWNGHIPWTTSKRIGESILLSSGERFISQKGLDESATHLVPKGNLLIATRVGVGKVAVNTIDIAISQDLTGLVVDKTRFNPFFIAFQLREQRLQAIFQAQTRGTTIKGIPREDLKQMAIITPPLKEQTRIAAALLRIQQAAEVHAARQKSYQDLFHTALHELITAQTRVKDLEIDTSQVANQPKE